MALRFLWFMALAFALVATVTFASGDSDDGAAMAAEKEYVTDPTTGKQVVKPAVRRDHYRCAAELQR